jgi:hypothetical protein
MDPKENLREICRFFLISFTLTIMVCNGIFSCVQQIKSLDIACQMKINAIITFHVKAGQCVPRPVEPYNTEVPDIIPKTVNCLWFINLPSKGGSQLTLASVWESRKIST